MALGLGLSLPVTTACGEPKEKLVFTSPGKSMVVMSQDDKFRHKEENFNVPQLQLALDKTAQRLTNTNDTTKAWQALFSPKDVVGIKVNTLAFRPVTTHPQLVEAIIKSLLAAGLNEKQIVVWDRMNYELQRAGFEINRSSKGTRCFGTEQDYEYEPEIVGSVGSCFSRILTSLCTALINVPVLKDHDLAGATLGLKNFYGAIHNPNKYHDNNCDPYVADVNTFPHIRNKLRLTICDGLNIQYHGGPAFKPKYRHKANLFLASLDAVAIDSVAIKIIEDKRKENGLPSLTEAGRPPKWLNTAEQRGLGNANPSNIEVIRL